jgi:hypothetical protein
MKEQCNKANTIVHLLGHAPRQLSGALVFIGHGRTELAHDLVIRVDLEITDGPHVQVELLVPAGHLIHIRSNLDDKLGFKLALKFRVYRVIPNDSSDAFR